MLIGLVSDTHNDIDATVKALEIFRVRGVSLIVHAGDITSPRMLEYFKDFDCRMVLGNGDIIDRDEINLKAASLDMRPVQEMMEFSCAGKMFAVFHGHDVPMFREAVSSGKFNYIIKGHTHFFENYITNDCRIINPGAVYGHDESSIALLDVQADRVEKISLDNE